MAALIGCDFSSRPTRRKPIVLALGVVDGANVQLQRLQTFESLDGFALWLREPADWLGAFDLPFGLPRELVRALGWPMEWEACMRHYTALTRGQIRDLFAAFCDARPVGAKFAHRATDRPAGSSPSMKWVNPPVAYMLHAGVPLLLEAGVHLPGLHRGAASDLDERGRPRRVALEAYPGLLAREVLGRRSYKSDDPAKQTVERQMHRSILVRALEHGETALGLHLQLTQVQRGQLLDDGSGDAVDAALCLVQAAWAAQRGWPWFGLPGNIDPLEGWIITAQSAVPFGP